MNIESPGSTPADHLQQEQTRLLELIAKGRSLHECLAALCAVVRRLSPGARASVLLAAEERAMFERPVTLDLLPSFRKDPGAAPIDELSVGTSGAALYSGEPVAAPDIENDSEWSQEWRELCIANGIRACFSSPVLGSDGQGIASFMLCFDEPRQPTEWEVRLAEFGVQMIGIALERERHNETHSRLRDEAERLRRLYEAIISGTPDLVYVFDLDYRFTFANDALLQMWGRTPEDSLGKRLVEVGYEEWHARMHEHEIDQIVATKQPIRGEVPFDHATQGRRIYDYILVPVIGADGEVEAVAGTTRDVTERKQAEEYLRRREESLSSDLADMERLHALSARLLQQDSLDEVLREVLKAATELMDTRFGSTQLFDARTESLDLVASVGFDEQFDELFSSQSSDEASTCSLALKSRDRVIVDDLGSSSRWTQLARALDPYGIHSVQSTPILGSDGRVLGVLSTHFDGPQQLSDRQLRLLDLYTQLAARQIEHEWSEQEVRELNASLEQRVRERTVELRAANQELEAFNYSVSHDLRAPLRSVEGFSRVLLEEHLESLEPEGQHFLERINAGAQRMGLLIDALLQLSRLTRSELVQEEIDLSEMAEEIAASLREKQPRRQVTFAIAPSIRAHGDRQLIAVALGGLLENASKFSAGSSEPVIEFGVDRSGEQPVYFIKDNGAGFDMRYADKLFAPFQRLHTATEFEGTGIGLATVQRIVHRHRGTIWADAAVNEGATFYFTLPGD